MPLPMVRILRVNDLCVAVNMVVTPRDRGVLRPATHNPSCWSQAIAHATGVEGSLNLPAPSQAPVGLSLQPKAPAHLPPPNTLRVDQFLATRTGPLLNNPITDTARQYLQVRYG
jgi:hypothetical protein